MRSKHRARRQPLALECFFYIALVAVAVPLCAQQTSQWHSFGSPADGFRAQFPVDPQVSKNSVPVGGDSFELRSYEAEAGSTALYVGVCDYGTKGVAADPDEMLTSAEKGAVDHMSAHILSERKIMLGVSHGVDFQAESDKLHFTSRMYMASGILYQIMVATPLNERFADTARFLDSLELFPPARAAASATPPAEWKLYNYADDGFSASFPSKPNLGKQTVTTEVGPVELRTYVSESSAGALIAAVCDYGASAAGKDPDVLLDDAKKGAVNNVKGHLMSERKITLGSHHGIAFEADSDTAHVSARLYLVGTTLFQMIVASPVSAQFPESARFLDSLQLAPPRTAD